MFHYSPLRRIFYKLSTKGGQILFHVATNSVIVVSSLMENEQELRNNKKLMTPKKPRILMFHIFESPRVPWIAQKLKRIALKLKLELKRKTLKFTISATFEKSKIHQSKGIYSL